MELVSKNILPSRHPRLLLCCAFASESQERLPTVRNKVVAKALICMTLNCYLWLPEIQARADWETPCVAMITFSCLRTHLALHRAAADSLEKQVMTL